MLSQIQVHEEHSLCFFSLETSKEIGLPQLRATDAADVPGLETEPRASATEATMCVGTLAGQAPGPPEEDGLWVSFTLWVWVVC